MTEVLQFPGLFLHSNWSPKDINLRRQLEAKGYKVQGIFGGSSTPVVVNSSRIYEGYDQIEDLLKIKFLPPQ